MSETPATQALRDAARAADVRAAGPAADRWAVGYGRIAHTPETQVRVFALVDELRRRGVTGDGVDPFELLAHADRLTSAAMWLVVHETYARHVFLDGRDLAASDFKTHPEGHTGGALNMVPAYVGYLLADALTGFTRSWVMGQGHCVAAIDSANLLAGNADEVHTARYPVTDEGLSRFVGDYYGVRLGDDGRPASPIGSHVNAHTAGGMVEGGYLGFTELQYVHMPLPGERLVAFLSDGAFEEQRGSDWAPRWWRHEDSGLVAPIMINNGRRIDQRTTMAQEGGTEWFVRHLELNSFDPVVIDGRDPAAFAWAIIEMEERLVAAGEAVGRGLDHYPVRLPYTVAVAPKGAGFYGEGTNLAHNLPLGLNPSVSAEGAARFNEHARRLWVPPAELEPARAAFSHHDVSRRVRERDHPLAHRDVSLAVAPEPVLRAVTDRDDSTKWSRASPMSAVDRTFVAVTSANPHLRPRVGNPDEMSSNRMLETLEQLRFRVTDPEPGLPESVLGAVVTALNEEAVASVALANKGGISIVVTYEAFGMKMHGVIRQELIFAGHLQRAGRRQGWLSIPVVLTSHTWENAKNEQSHQDPALAETMLGEWSDLSRVLFVPDHNTAAVVTRALYETHGQIWTLVVPKSDTIPDLFTREEAEALLADGACRLDWAGLDPTNPAVTLTATGAFQLEEVLRASRRLAERAVPHSLVYLLEPGRFRVPRTEGEAAHVASPDVVRDLWPESVPARVFVTHTRPEPFTGVLQRLHTGPDRTAMLGYADRGGTLDVARLLFLNHCSWAHVVAATAAVTGRSRDELLTPDELAALDGRRSPEGVIVALP